ncbi:peptidase domain-containing ABC transporter [Roseomonas oryzicola]|uniref:Peptidase domain-containing ABC transporter n=1 Tax=Neoroseomonas oryzicola TaxID=535904 RepID=A0A9X9WDM6_9PROT|nr:peptidase domain-containing ABC transporter [Neoroseomonas oryzicola]NKE17625.1 peptidase domain-containing ABC transporter [Neoroseomonas oryzicola]
MLAPELTALRCLFLVASHHGLRLGPEDLPAAGAPDMLPAVLGTMRRIGLDARALTGCGWDKAEGLGSAYPALAVRRDGSWVVLVHVMPGPDGAPSAAVLDPAQEASGVQLVPRERFLADWAGTLVLCRRAAEQEDHRPFGFAWFLPEIARHRAFLSGVAVAAVLSNLIAFAIPLLFQLLIDRVVAHEAWQTLVTVVLVFALLTAFDGFFGYARQRLMLLATNRIDARLGARTFAHLLSLPLCFFEAHPAGVLVRHMQQTEKLRHFLTGRLFQTLLDAALLPLLLVLLAIYSGLLTVVVLGFSAAIAAVIGAMVPAFRRRLNALYAAEGARQAHLVETLHNMRAVKSLVLEPARQRAWDAQLATAVRAHAAVGRLSAAGGVATTVLERLMQISVLGLGATLVFEGQLTVGALVAFTMLSGRVTGPLVQIVALINEYQEAALSVRMLGTVMHAEPEAPPTRRLSRPPIAGALAFDGVTFRYPGAATPALDRVSFTLHQGQVLGVVGRSGSGKTTLTRLIQGIHAPQEGLIRFGDADIRTIELDHLRRHVGVVLQENLLFRGTLRDNIAAARPGAPLPEVLEAARLAGALEFIERLPRALDTVVEEGGANFSGGQRQRIAIARALITRPPLLILDEATSALDPDSEAIIQANLQEIARGRTMIIVSHRLSSLVAADAILVLDQGRALDVAPHAALLDRCEVYRHLWQQQTRHLR